MLDEQSILSHSFAVFLDVLLPPGTSRQQKSPPLETLRLVVCETWAETSLSGNVSGHFPGQRAMNGIFRDKRLKALGKRSDVWAEAEFDAAEIVSAHQISMCSYTASLETVCLLLSNALHGSDGRSIFMGRQLRCMRLFHLFLLFY